jgi:hypothetical protein
MKAQLQAMRAAREAEKKAEAESSGAGCLPDHTGTSAAIASEWTILDDSAPPKVADWSGGDAEWPNCLEASEELDATAAVAKPARFEAFSLRVVYEAGRTGFEEAKDFTAQVGAIIAGRYKVCDFLGSAAFSSALACTDLHTNTDVCLKIIKNNKDFLDQSLDEIKLLRYINSQVN